MKSRIHSFDTSITSRKLDFRKKVSNFIKTKATKINTIIIVCFFISKITFGQNIGSLYEGGILFYDDGAGNGLVCAPTDQSGNAPWGCIGNVISGADGTAIGTGMQNTIDILNDCSTGGIAAGLCANYNGGGYTDWYLPSRDELSLMYQSVGPGASGANNNIGGFVQLANYWSSSEASINFGWIVYFNDGTQNALSKDGPYADRVRAIRQVSLPSANCCTDLACDSLALVAIYEAMDGDIGTWTTDWDLNMPVDTWHGVTVTNNRVTDLNLNNNGLIGNIPDEIGALCELETLRLTNNQGLSGNIPTSLINLVNLTLLDLQGNGLTGNMPQEVWMLPVLSHLNLSRNSFSGDIPIIPTSLPNLTEVYLNDNWDNGVGGFESIPQSIVNLTGVEVLWLFWNDMTGSILPQEIWDLNTLVDLNIAVCNLDGYIGSGIGNMSNLFKLDCQLNNLTDATHLIPEAIWELPVLNYLSLRDNNFATTTLTSKMWEAPALETLHLMENGFDQDLPEINSSYTNNVLKTFLFQDCNFSSLPSNIDQLAVLEKLNGTNNDMTGEVLPIVMGNINSLITVDLANCQLSGQIPTGMTGLSNLTKLELGGNKLNYTVPDFSSTNPNLNLYIENNQFTFDGIEINAQNWPAGGGVLSYSPQALIPITQNGNKLEVSPGGTSSNNNYQWYRNGAMFSNDASPTITQAGTYYVEITNSVATDLTLVSDNIVVTNPTSCCTDLACDRLALIEIYNATGGPNGDWVNDWDLNTYVDTWYGVTVTNNRVTELELQNGLTGSIPVEVGSLCELELLSFKDNPDLSGNIPSSIENLQNLTYLDLQGGDLGGSFPPEIWTLSNLEVLRLNGNTNLSGTIPDIPVGDNLPNLIELRLENCGFNSTPQSFVNLPALEDFRITNNPMTGFTFPADFWSLTNLRVISMNNCGLSGSILPAIGGMTNLESLTLQINNFTGNLPSEVWTSTNLWYLGVDSNPMDGDIPDFPSTSRPNLTHLYLGRSNFTDFPANFGSVPNLEVFQLTDCISLAGKTIPNDLYTCSHLELIDFNGCELDGQVSSQISQIPSLKFVYLERNNFENPVPLFSNVAANNGDVGLNYNQFTFEGIEQNVASGGNFNIFQYGQQDLIPIVQNGNTLEVSPGGDPSTDTYNWYKDGVFYSNDSSPTITQTGSYYVEVNNSVATALTLRSENLVVTNPTSCCTDLACDRLALIEFYNGVTGLNWDTTTPVNTWQGITVSNGRVTQLNISNMNLTGTIAPDLGALCALEFLGLSSNQLTGSIPEELGQLSNLQYLHLPYNDLTGPIPLDLGISGPSGYSGLTDIIEIELQGNDLTGTLPVTFGALPNITKLDLSSNVIEGGIPIEYSNFVVLEYLGLSYNQLTGSIPGNISELSTLRFLYLNDNQLVGAIPADLGKLSNLEFFYASYNDLTGSIPLDLGIGGPSGYSGLTDVIEIQLQGNDLTGTLPVTFGALPNITKLDLSGNVLEGAIPIEYGNFVVLEYLGLNNNQLIGSIPPDLGDLSTLVRLDLSINLLNCDIPADLGKLSNLKYFYASYNDLTGAVPADLSTGGPSGYTGLTNLIELNLEGNDLISPLPDFTSLTNLSNLQIASNFFIFDGLEVNAMSGNYSFSYSPQARIPIVQNGNTLEVSPGGDPSTDTFNWYKDGVLLSTGNSPSITITQAGSYYAEVTNSVATALTLRSENISVDFGSLQNKSLDFDGIDDYVDLGSNVCNGMRTIELWFNPSVTIDNTISDFISLAVRNTPGEIDEMYLAFENINPNKGKIRFGRQNSGTFLIHSDCDTWNANQWYHVAGVFHPTDGLKLYINGVAQNDTDPHTGAPGVRPEITSLGSWGDFNGRFFNGKIDEVRFWSVARTQSEIQNNMNSELTGTESGLISYYKMDQDNSSCDIEDCNSNENHGARKGSGGSNNLAQYSTDVPSLIDVACGASISCSVLPVELLEFAGSAKENYIQLDWMTANEFNNLGFEIQKSKNGREWETLDFAEGQGTTTEVNKYDYQDANPFLGINYYRLRQIDFDGTFEYSMIRTVFFERERFLKIFPNPTFDKVTVEIGEIKGEITVQLFNTASEVLKNFVHMPENTDFQIDFRGLPKGAYFLKVNNGNQIIWKRIIYQ